MTSTPAFILPSDSSTAQALIEQWDYYQPVGPCYEEIAQAIATCIAAEREAVHAKYRALVKRAQFNDDHAQTVVMADEILAVSTEAIA